MTKKTSVTRNVIYQTLYQCLNTVLPLITAPVLSRVLGANALGVFSYTSANVSYFTSIAMLGIVNYGTRSIASASESGDYKRTVFNEIFSIQIVSSCFAIALYLYYVLEFVTDDRLIAIVQGIDIISALININWLYFGIEDFELTVKRNFVVRIASVLLILFLIKKPSDLWKYCLIVCGSTFFSNLYLWFFLRNVINGKFTFTINRKHLIPIVKLFIPLLAMSVYHSMDKTMLGALSSKDQSGFYYNADKIINIPIGVLTGFGTVLLPRITSLIKHDKVNEANELFFISIETILFSSSAVAFGISSIANEFVPFFFGEGYEACVLLIRVLSPVLLVKGLSLIVRLEYLIPRNKDNYYIKTTIAGALINLLANYMLIPRYGSLGAVYGTLIAECAVCFWQYFEIRKEINCFPHLLKCLIYCLFGMLMFVWVRYIASILFKLSTYVQLLLEIGSGAIVYLLLCLSYWKISNNHFFDFIIRRNK